MTTDFKPLSSASIWILKKYIELENDLDKHIVNYEIAHSVDNLYKFLWDDFADWYVEYLKTDDTQTPFAKELFRQYVITLSPYSPFETEALWKDFFGEASVLAFEVKDQNWSKQVLEKNSSENSLKHNEFDIVISFIQNLRSLRGLFAIDPVNLVEIYTINDILLKYAEFIKLVGRGEVINSDKNEFYTVKTSDYTYFLDIFAYIKDKESEIKRTQKTITDLQKQINALESQLKNEKFLSNADSEVVVEKQQSLVDRRLELLQQEGKLKVLGITK